MVTAAFLRSGGREGLTGTTTRPNRSVIGPSGKPEGKAPSANSGEEVTLGVSRKVSGVEGLDVAFINVSLGDQAVRNQFAQPRGGERIMLVVVGAHARRRTKSRRCCSCSWAFSLRLRRRGCLAPR